MNHAAEPEVLGGLGIFEKTCVYCGARFRVLATLAPAANQPQSYDCPGCGKAYEIEAVAPPQLRLLRGRTDGRDDRYQETMF
jgi:hypothetical protein